MSSFIKIILLFSCFIYSYQAKASYTIETNYAICLDYEANRSWLTTRNCYNYPSIYAIGFGTSSTDPNTSSINWSYGTNGSCPSGTTFQTSNGLCSSNCPTNSTWDSTTSSCACNSGYYMAAGSCVVKPPDCTTQDIQTICNTVCVGTYVAPVAECWATGPQLDGSGCNTGGGATALAGFSGCAAVCLGDSTEDPTTHACIDPTCVGGQTLENHSCFEPTCVGGQTYNAETHSCEAPVCGDGYTATSPQWTCTFAGCPAGYVQGTINGTTACIKSGDETDGHGDGTTTTETDGESTTTTNPDGSTTTTTTSTSTSTTNVDITMDTAGLAQESTLNAINEKLTGEAASPGEETGSGVWYEGTDLTYETVLQGSLTQLQATPLMSFGTDIFSVTLPSGQCPTWSIPSVMGMNAVDIAPLCSDFMEDMWPIISAAIQAVSVFMAFRIAMSAF